MWPLVRQRALAAGVGPDVHLCEHVVLHIWSLFGQEPQASHGLRTHCAAYLVSFWAGKAPLPKAVSCCSPELVLRTHKGLVTS